MAKALMPSLPSTLIISITTTTLFISFPLALGWMPRLFTSHGVPKSATLTNGARSGRFSLVGGQRVSLWMGNGFKENGPDSDDEKDDSDHDRHEDDRLPLFADGKLPDYISRLEALYGMNTNSYVDHLEGKTPQPFWQEEERLVLEGWIDFVEGPCVDDSCGDEQCEIPEEYKINANNNKDVPKVDVMSFLGIRRAEPLQVRRDWD